MLNAYCRFQTRYHDTVRNNRFAIVSHEYKQQKDRECNEPQASLCKEMKRLNADLLVSRNKVEIYLLDEDNRLLYAVLAEKESI